MRTHLEHAAAVSALLAPVFARLRATAPEEIAISDPALSGRVAARDVVSAIPLPPFENSQMDGYAVRVSDFAGTGPVVLPVGGATAAGDPPGAHAPGSAAPVMTGAALPRGADAVIPIELADPPRFGALRRGAAHGPAGVDLGSVSFAAAPRIGAFVRACGSDLAEGSPVVRAGARLRPSLIGLLASAGVASVAVLPRPRVLLVSTGDEVVEAGAPLTPGRIYDANAPLLTAALHDAGARVTSRRIADQPDALRALVRSAADDHDLLITSGGISAGAYEVVREALSDADGGADRVEFSSIALQPGGPQGLGIAQVDGARIATLCFPGNPVSSALSAELFLLPELRAYGGLPDAAPRSTVPLAHGVESPAGKHQVRRGRLDASGRAVLTPPSSHLLADLAGAEILAHIPVGVAALAAGAPIEIQRFDV